MRRRLFINLGGAYKGFWRKTYAVAVKEFIQLRRDRVSFAMIIMIPLVQLMLFGYAAQSFASLAIDSAPPSPHANSSRAMSDPILTYVLNGRPRGLFDCPSGHKARTGR